MSDYTQSYFVSRLEAEIADLTAKLAAAEDRNRRLVLTVFKMQPDWDAAEVERNEMVAAMDQRDEQSVALEAKLAKATAVIRRLDWSNIHTHYGFTATCEDCNYYAMLTQAQSSTGPAETETPGGGA